MSSKVVIMQVSYVSAGANAAYKTVAFIPNMTVEAARDLCAQKGGVTESKENYGLCIKDTTTWLQPGDTLDKYNLQNAAGLEYKLNPKTTTIQYEGVEKSLVLDFSLTGSEVLAVILEALGEPKSNEFSLQAYENDTKGGSIDYTRPLVEQVNPAQVRFVVKKKSKIGGIFRRTDSLSKNKRDTVIHNLANTLTTNTRIFGVPLAQVAHPAKYGGLPAVAAKTIEYLEETALQLEGIFRISGNQSEVLALKKAFDDGVDVNVRECSSPHVVAGLLKLYLRDLPEPLFSFILYDLFIAVYNTVNDTETKIGYYKVMIDSLPLANRKLLYRILPFLVAVVKNENVNKMAIHNVATVFGPNMLRSSDNSAMVMIQGTAAVNAITCDLIKNCDTIIQNLEYDFCAIGRALYAYEGNSESELSFKEGDIVFIIKEDETGWWEGEVNGNYGFFPKNYIESVVQLAKKQKTDAEEESTTSSQRLSATPAPSTTTSTTLVVDDTPNEPVSESPRAAATTHHNVVKQEEEHQAVHEPEPSYVSDTVSEPVSEAVVPPKPNERRGSRPSTAGTSKQKFLNDLDDLKKAVFVETAENQQTKALVQSLIAQIATLQSDLAAVTMKQNSQTSASVPATSQSNNNDSGVSVEQFHTVLQENAELRSVVEQLEGSYAHSQNEIRQLREEGEALRQDLNALMLRVDKHDKQLSETSSSTSTSNSSSSTGGNVGPGPPQRRTIPPKQNVRPGETSDEPLKPATGVMNRSTSYAEPMKPPFRPAAATVSTPPTSKQSVVETVSVVEEEGGGSPVTKRRAAPSLPASAAPAMPSKPAMPAKPVFNKPKPPGGTRNLI